MQCKVTWPSAFGGKGLGGAASRSRAQITAFQSGLRLLHLCGRLGEVYLLESCLPLSRGCQKCDQVHRDARWIGRLSHQSSDLSHLCNPLQKVVIHAFSDTGFEGMQVVSYPANKKRKSCQLQVHSRNL